MTIKVGDILNFAGSTPLLDASTLFGQQWINAPSADGKIKASSGWQLGYEGGWSANEDGTGPVNVAAINPGSELGVYLMSAGVANLGIQPPIKVDDPAKGPLRITPRLMTAAERAKINTRSVLATYTWLSAAMVTRDALAPPAYFEITAQLPKGAGCWPAWWFLRSGQWPPEIDCFEIFNTQMTTAIHSTAGEWITKPLTDTTTFVRNSGPDFAALQNISPGFDPSAAPHRYGTLIYPDQICLFIDGVCKQVWPVPADLAHSPLYALINFAVGAPGSGAGTPPAGATSVGSYVISGIDIRAMPAVYASGVITPPPPPPPPPPTTGLTIDSAIPSTVSGALPLSGSAGTSWVNVGLFNGAGVNVGADVKPANGKWAMKIDTTKLPAGANALTLMAFSVPSGQAGGTSASVPITLNVSQVAPPPPTGVTAAQIAIITAAQGVAQTALTQVATDMAVAQAAQAKVQTLLAALKPAN